MFWVFLIYYKESIVDKANIVKEKINKALILWNFSRTFCCWKL